MLVDTSVYALYKVLLAIMEDTTRPGHRAWGPFIPEDFYIQPLSRASNIVSGCAFAVAILLAFLAGYIAVGQTKASRTPKRSPYIWMIWLELIACVALAIECMCYLHKAIDPSFYFFMSILFFWAIQVQLLLQIIINRIRVILPDRKKGRRITIGVAVAITVINICVFCVWIPARLQISERWIYVNSIWDRTEKVLYLLIDATLNWYFIHVVKANLVEHGLEKYNALVRFNQRIIVVSLLMDVMIIGAMSIPNGFVYTIFHPLAFLVKLNIEMTMARLIKKVALSQKRNQHCSNLVTFASTSSDKFSDKNNSKLSHRSAVWFRSIRHSNLACQRQFHDDQILKTEEFLVQSDTRPNSLEPTQILNSGLVRTRKEESSSSKYSDRTLHEEDAEVGLEYSLSRSEDLEAYDWVEDQDIIAIPEPALRREP